MKKIFFLIVAIFGGASCLAQNVSISNKVSIKPSDGMKRVNQQERSSFINEKFGRDNVAINAASTGNPDYSCIKDGVLISLFYADRNSDSKDTYLEDTKKMLLETAKRMKSYNSSIKKLNNNNTVLVTNYVINDVEYYYFFCNNSNNMKGLNGALQFNKADKEKATQILNDLLKDVNFEK